MKFWKEFKFKYLRNLKPKMYICRDVIWIKWLNQEWIVPRWFKDGD